MRLRSIREKRGGWGDIFKNNKQTNAVYKMIKHIQINQMQGATKVNHRKSIQENGRKLK